MFYFIVFLIQPFWLPYSIHVDWYLYVQSDQQR